MTAAPTGRTFVIAEAGVNHNGSLDLARQLVHAAREAGADAVKFQTFKAERVAQTDAPKAAYQLRNTDNAESQIEMLRKLELPAEAHRELLDLCGSLGLEFMSTPYNEEDADFLAALGVQTFKLASIHLAEPHFLRYVARKKRRLLLATGMATLDEVGLAVRALREGGCDDFTLLQCTTNYPSRTEDANLRAIATLRAAFGCPVGYSDHTQTDVAPLAAVALGATIIEKHFTLDRTLPGPDHSSAAEPAEFAALVRRIREVEAALGSGIKQPCEAELANVRQMRRSLVARRAIAAGEVLTEDALTCKRPATGISPQQVAEIAGRRTVVPIPAGTPLAWSMLE